MWIWIIILGVIILGMSLFILFIGGWLYSSHQIRFSEGYDKDLESDYQALVEQMRK
ncbi:hypothetical protein [Streptococcus hyointestinalis]|nr:hypothetical protein [Streptococcus hyointestinalis]